MIILVGHSTSFHAGTKKFLFAALEQALYVYRGDGSSSTESAMFHYKPNTGTREAFCIFLHF